MDGDRPVADGRDIFESWIQESVRQTIEEDNRIIEQQREFLKSLIPNHDSETSNVGSQDETSEEGEMGNGVRSESCLSPFFIHPDPCKKIQNEAAKELSDIWCKYQMLYPDAELVQKSEKEENPDGSVVYRIIYKITKPQVNGPI